MKTKYNFRPTQRKATLLAVCFILSGCVSIPSQQRVESDPWESMNRGIYNANVVVDKLTLKPLAAGYRMITPDPVEKGVSNFFANLSTPASSLNNFLQGKGARGFSELGRFLVNSTVGIGGIIDVTGASGVEAYEEDFAQTAGVWGVPSGPYLMLPLLGPTTLRGAITMPFDAAADPLSHYDNSSARDPLIVLRIIDLRSRIAAAEKFLEDSKDPYLTLRESYLQNHEFEVYDGNPPEDDDFFDEFYDEDE